MNREKGNTEDSKIPFGGNGKRSGKNDCDLRHSSGVGQPGAFGGQL